MVNRMFPALLLVISLSHGFVEAAIPLFTSDFTNFFIHEDTPVDSSVFKLQAVGDGPIKYKIVADMFSVDEDFGDVILTRQVDYDIGEILLKITVIATDRNGLDASVDLAIDVLDANDNPAKFTKTRYKIQVPENKEINSTIFDKLIVKDKDYVNIQTGIEVTCDNTRVENLYKESCEIFKIQSSRYSKRKWEGRLILQRALDFETRPTYQISLKTWDGQNSFQQSFEVEIIDVNDAPPYFIRQVQATVKETVANGSIVNYVIAVDGDKNNQREIRYTLDCNKGEYFALDYVTGDITTIKILDRETENLVLGYVDLCITASEVIESNPELIGNTSETTVSTTIRINIQDENDNAPKFEKTTYTVEIPEDIPNESALPELSMTVNDYDTGTANVYRFILLNHTDVFAIFPDTGQSQTTASIKVIDTNKIDYEVGPRVYYLQVQAVETETSVHRTGEVSVTVFILNVNDNSPVFNPPNYIKDIFENAAGGTPVVTVKATDEDDMKKDIRFSLVGNGADKFIIDNITGVITVAPCSTPGENNCIDYEQRKVYQLTVMARDEFGNGRQSTGSLKVNVLNVNDNPPIFRTKSYVRYINEGESRTIDRLIIQTNDLDGNTIASPGSPTTYQLSASHLLWQINSNTGEITARRPIQYEDALNGSFIFAAIASNSGSKPHRTSVRVQIHVIDKNNYAPEFQPSVYTEHIDEDTVGNKTIITITATDKDSPTSENGKVEYTIDVGSQGKFTISRKGGIITTTSVATFDYDKQTNYTLIILAQDGGNPQKTGTATVYVIIRDINNQNPYFVPTTQRFEVRENVRANVKVYEVKATDPDVGNKLSYSFEGPKSAITPQGTEVNVNVYDYTTLFRMDPNTGYVITTGNNLNRDRASVITYQMIVTDTKKPDQHGTGTVIITVTEFNDEAPYFAYPQYNITINEELPIGTFIISLIAQDKNDVISAYQITDNPRNFFTISSQTGVISINNRIDYERDKFAYFDVEATDNGNPRLTGSTKVYVTIVNINDNSPQFNQTTYSVRVPEQRGPSDVLMTVWATDIDDGDYGEVRYKLNPSEKRFKINLNTGKIQLNAGFELDRETESIIAIQVTAYDCPNTPNPETIRREYTIPVYFELLDVNDNNPKFTQKDFHATIIETMPVDSEVLTLLADDRDSGLNSALVFNKSRNTLDPDDLFQIGIISGKVYVEKVLLGRYGEYKFEVEVRDRSGEIGKFLFDTATVTIKVLEATNSPPVWILPPRANMTIFVLESQYLGMLVYDSHAEDKDSDNSGIIDYGFYHLGKYTNQTDEFHINQVTGVIRAQIVYDREQVDKYFLQLVARDRGDPFLESTRFVTVSILDVNDNKPMFPMVNGIVQPFEFFVNEGSHVGTSVGAVIATDRDLAQYSKIYYSILAGNEEDIFSIDKMTGNLTLNKVIDREAVKRDMFILYIHATNDVSDFSVVRYRKKREVNPSIAEVRINIIDANDQTPTFIFPIGANEYHGCISLNAPYGQSVVHLQADDLDSVGPAALTFAISSGNTNNMFFINQKTGLISNRDFLNNYNERIYQLMVVVTDGKNQAQTQVKIFVTSTENEEKLVISQKISETRLMTLQLIRTLSGIQNIDYVCVTGIREHVLDDGKLSAVKTDVYIATITKNPADGAYTILGSDDLHNKLVSARNKNKDAFNALYINELGVKSATGLSLTSTPVLVVLIIILLLIILAFILFCLACFCIRDAKRKKLEKYNDKHGAVITVAEQPVDNVKSVNPIYDNRAFHPAPVAAPAPVPHAEIIDEDPAVFIPQADPAVFISQPDPEPEPEHQYAAVQREPKQADPDIDEPVIVTTIEPDYNPEPVEEPAYEPQEPEPFIETIFEDEPPSPVLDFPPPIVEEEIDTVIIDDSLPPSPDNPRRYTTDPIQEEDEPRH